MTGVNSEGDAGIYEVFLTIRDEIGSLTTLACKFTPQSTFGQQINKIKKNKQKRKVKSPSLV